MSEIALYEPQAVMLTEKQLNIIANTEFVPKAFRGNLAMIAAAIATSRAYGVPDIIGLRNIHVVDGKAELSAAMMTGIVARAGHKIEGEFGDDHATAIGERADNGAKMSVSFTMAQAKAANLLGKKNWQQYAEDMMWSRAVSRLCRRLFADCFLGAVYATGELEGDDDDVTADELLDDSVPFDSGPLPDSEDQSVQLGFGGLTEPDGDFTSSDTDTSVRMEPVGNAGSPSGSVSSWADLKTAGASIGLTPDELRGRAKIEFMGRSAADVTAEEWNAFWVSLRDSVKVEA